MGAPRPLGEPPNSEPPFFPKPLYPFLNLKRHPILTYLTLGINTDHKTFTPFSSTNKEGMKNDIDNSRQAA
jgi:hypothetical protein